MTPFIDQTCICGHQRAQHKERTHNHDAFCDSFACMCPGFIPWRYSLKMPLNKRIIRMFGWEVLIEGYHYTTAEGEPVCQPKKE